MSVSGLKVTSHVARDLLQSSELFKHPQTVIWEYVANGLQYVDPGVSPTVDVQLGQRRITISDNGRGMTAADLARFFTMHAENLDRQQGRAGRGYFGTGKSAAFAIADTLRLDTVRDGKRSIVELTRADLIAATDGSPVPVRELMLERPCSQPNGTTVVIDALRPRVDHREVIRTLETHLRFGWRGATVTVDGETLEAATPPFSREVSFKASSADHPGLNGAVMVLRVSKAPLPKEERGVAILAHDVLHEVTLAGAEGKEMSQYIFGELDVPRLSTTFEGVAAFDMSRSGQLNPANALVLATYAFVGRHVEALRRELVTEERRRRAAEENRRLQAQAEEIARLINEDYSEFRKRFKPAASSPLGSGGEGRRPSAEGEPLLVHGGAEPARERPDEAGGDKGGGRGGSDGEAAPTSQLDPAPPEAADAAGRPEVGQSRPNRRAGGFQVDYRENGVDTDRAIYVPDTRTIQINLDHPQLAAAKPEEGAADDPLFRRLSFEIAFTEYAIAFAQEMAISGHYMEPSEALTELRSKIDVLSRKAAALFSA